MSPPPAAAAPSPPPEPKHLKCYQRRQFLESTTDSDFYWTSGYADIQKACFLARICLKNPPKTCQYINIPSIIQNGPTCGLVCISMLCGGAITPEELLIKAKSLNYTNNGEMFSAQNLFQLICDNLLTLTKTTTKTNVFLHKGNLNCVKVKEYLQAGSCIFVPYDPDFNHTPCLRNGHKAHWALIIGYLIKDDDEFHVLARHGKTKNIGIWSLEALSESNANLYEFEQPKLHPNCDFILPSGGIGGGGGLRERAIIVKGLPHELIKLK